MGTEEVVIIQGKKYTRGKGKVARSCSVFPSE